MTQQLTAMVTPFRMLYPRSGFKGGDWCILLCNVDNVLEGEPYTTQAICVKGTAYTVDIGTQYRLVGEFINDPKYGMGYNIITFGKDCDLTDPTQQRMYLETICTQNQVEELYKAISDPYAAIQSGDIEQIKQAKGFGDTTAQKLIVKFNSKLADSVAYITLSQYGMSNESISNLLKKFTSSQAAINAVETNPYLMISEVDGIGWKRADAIALAKGLAPNSIARIKAYIEYRLDSDAEYGDTWTTPSQLIALAFDDLEISDQDQFRAALFEMHDVDKTLWWDDDRSRIGLQKLRTLEENISKELYRLSTAEPRSSTYYYRHEALQEIEAEQGWEFTEEQHNAIQMVLENNVSIITGYGGTGKSSVVSGVLKVLDNTNFAQCALSGRAAARLTEVTGTAGKTIHRLLGWYCGEFIYNQDNPLPYDIIILDEISMVGAEIFHDLIKSIPSGAKLIMLGDDGQLESIGLCNLCSDMLDSGSIPVARLTTIHRQAAKSAIITESIKVRQGQQLIETGWLGEETRGELQDLNLCIFSESILSQDTVIQQYRKLLMQGISPYDIQIVVPMRVRGSISTMSLNKTIQEMVNPDSQGIDMETVINKQKNSFRLSVGDRVIIMRNTYDSVKTIHRDNEELTEECPVYNGDRGIIKEITVSYAIVTFDLWGDVFLNAKQLKNVELGYALTCHKLQGSEAPYVIIGIDDTSRMMLTKEWLYTAITRAKKHCIVCAQSKILSYAISTSNIPIKRTMLKELLIHDFTNSEQVISDGGVML